MNNKYYTPTIEEFHIGFEYEHDLSEWRQYQINNLEDLEFLSSDLIHNAVLEDFRVKYLDQEDIESFGWKKVNSDYYSNIYFKGRWTLIHDIKTELYTIEEEIDGEYSKSRIVDINIKNKSEFKRILKQVNII